MLEYPFLKYYTSANEKQLKGHISLRGGCMVDTFTHTVKNVKHPGTSSALVHLRGEGRLMP